MATRKTITIHPVIYAWIQSLRARFLDSGNEVSFTTAANLLLLGGIYGGDYLKEEDWQRLGEFFLEEGDSLELDSLTDQRADHFLTNLTRIADDRDDQDTGLT